MGSSGLNWEAYAVSYLCSHGEPIRRNYDSSPTSAKAVDLAGEHFAAVACGSPRYCGHAGTEGVDVRTGLESIRRPGDFKRDARFNEYDHLSLLGFFEGERPGHRASGDRASTSRPSAAPCSSGHDTMMLVAGGGSWAEFGARIRAGVAAACAGLGRDDNC